MNAAIEQVGYWTREEVVKMDNRALAKLISAHPEMTPPALKEVFSEYAMRCWHTKQKATRVVFVPENADKILMDLFKAIPDLVPVGEQNEQQRARSYVSLAQSIRATVAQKHGITLTELDNHYRGQRYTKARHEAMYLVARDTKLSYPRIGRMFGGRDHTSVLHGVIRYANRNGLPRVREKQAREPVER